MTKTTISARATDAQISAIRGTEKARMISDAATANLYLVVSPLGAKAWRWQSVMSKQTVKFAIGKFGVVGLAAARDKAKECNELRARGLNPRDEFERIAAAAEQEEREAEAEAETEAAASALEESTVAHVFGLWLGFKEYAGGARKSLYEYNRIIKANLLPAYGAKPIRDLTKADIEAAIKVMQARGSIAQSNLFLRVVQPFLDWAAGSDFVATNVAEKIIFASKEAERPVDSKRSHSERALSVRELALVYRASATMDPDDRDALRLLILTGQRKNAACGARRVDYQAGVWTLPRSTHTIGRHTYPVSHSKTEREHPMPLPSLAASIFDARKDREFLFHDCPHKDMMPTLAQDAQAAIKVMTGTALEYWTVHDIRAGVRTALSSDEMDEMLEREGRGEVFSENIGEIVLNHSLGKLNRTYNKSRYQRQIGRALAALERLLLEEIARQESPAMEMAEAA